MEAARTEVARTTLNSEDPLNHHLASSGWDRSGQLGGAGQILIDASGAGATLGDRPDDQRLPSPGIPADEDTIHTGGVVLIPRHVAALI
jgi:hypothetical protein